MAEIRLFEPPVAPSDVPASRQMRETRYRTPEGRIRIVRLYDAYSVDDVELNMAKAYLVALKQGTGYDRPPTPMRLKKTLTRVGLVY